MTTPTQLDLLTLTEYIRLYEQEGPFEIIDGERVMLVPPVALHAFMIRALFVILYQHCNDNQLGEVLTETPFVLTYNQQWVRGSRIPDLMFISAHRWQDYIANDPDWESKPIVLVPDLAVEVVSSNDLYTDIQAKVEKYLEDGVMLVWVLDPKRKRVMTYAGNQYALLTDDNVLDASPVIPDLKIDLKTLFMTK